MNPRHLARTGIVLAFGIVALACSAGQNGTATAQPSKLTVWLMNGSAPQAVVDGVNADFNARHPGVKVDVQIQQWSDITTKLDTAFAGSAPPDVLEFGNTDVAKYAAAGALSNVASQKGTFENSSTWLRSLTDSCTMGGRLYCVPYYAGSRAIVYRKDMFASVVRPCCDCGESRVPVHLPPLLAAMSPPMSQMKGRAAYQYFPGK